MEDNLLKSLTQRKLEEIIDKRVEEKIRSRSINQNDIFPQTIKQYHIDGNIIHFGLAANRPDGKSDVKVYFATNTSTLSLWNGSAWVDFV